MLVSTLTDYRSWILSYQCIADNRDGPGEASGVIYPGDILLRINQKAVGFKQMLEEMNSLQDDQMVDLEFGSYHEHWKVAEKLTAHSEKENEGLRKHIQEIETQLRRQNQCGILLEKKVASFRQQLFNMYQKHQDLNVRHNQLQKKMSSIEKHTVIEI